MKIIKPLFNLKKIVPKSILIRLDPENYAITKFIRTIASEIEHSSKVLDAGAGNQPYKHFFSHTIYESTDIIQVYNSNKKPIHSFICSLDKIPKLDNSYDVIISTQVLEHVKYPQIVVKEFYRILKPGGKLFLTAPQGWGVHGEPHHYFNFTIYGLTEIFRDAGFKIKYIKPRGGIFWDLSKRLSIMPHYILYQYFSITKETFFHKILHKIVILILTLLYIVTVPIFYFLLPLILFYLDFLDKKKNFTLGYACECIKS